VARAGYPLRPRRPTYSQVLACAGDLLQADLQHGRGQRPLPARAPREVDQVPLQVRAALDEDRETPHRDGRSLRLPAACGQPPVDLFYTERCGFLGQSVTLSHA